MGQGWPPHPSVETAAQAVASSRPDPSAWHRRLPVALLALLGCAISTYLTLYQWRVTHSVWDPVFGPASSAAVLTSFVSRALPVPDATLGAAAYLVESVLAALGGPGRWRSSPLLVLALGAVLVAMGVTSLFLVLAQPLLFHTACLLCLASATISFANAALATDEVAASVRYLRKRAAGRTMSAEGAHDHITNTKSRRRSA